MSQHHQITGLLAWALVAAWPVSGPLAQESAVTQEAIAESTKEVKFIDIARFDRELSKELTSGKLVARVTFYTRTTPNDIPVRLQKWVKAVEDAGGEVNIVPPPDELTPKSPLMLIGLLGSLWSSLKALNEITEEQVLKSAKTHDVEFKLNRAPDGSVFVSSIDFKRKP